MTHPNSGLEALHDHYVQAVNIAVAGDDFTAVDRLVAEYDHEARALRGRHAA